MLMTIVTPKARCLVNFCKAFAIICNTAKSSNQVTTIESVHFKVMLAINFTARRMLWRLLGFANNSQFWSDCRLCVLIAVSLILFATNSKTTCELQPPPTTSPVVTTSSAAPLPFDSIANQTPPLKAVALDSQLDNIQAYNGVVAHFQEEPIISENSIDSADSPSSSLEILTDNNQYHHVDCGTLSANKTKLLVRNFNYPEPIYSKTICETVIKRADPTITRLTIRFKLLQLYRPTLNGQCLHDRFAVFTDLNALLTPVICGDSSGKTLTVPFPIQSSVIISITTSDLDHDRFWWIEIEQEK